MAQAVVQAEAWVEEQTAPQVGQLPPGPGAGPDAHEQWFTATGGGTMQRYLGLRLAEVWTGEPWREALRLGITLAVLIAAARLLWVQSVEGRPVVPLLASLLLKLMLGFLVVYQPGWLYGLARTLQTALLAVATLAWGGDTPGTAPAQLLAERLALQRGVLEAVAARQPVLVDEAATGAGEVALAAHEAWLAERGAGPPPVEEPISADPETAGRRRAERFREVAWRHAHWLGPPSERLTLAASGDFVGVTGVVPLGAQLETWRAQWREQLTATADAVSPGADGQALTDLRRGARERALVFLDETLLRPALQRSLLDGVVDALQAWARHVAARLGRVVQGGNLTRDVAERVTEGVGALISGALGWAAVVGAQLVLELAVGGVLLAFPLSFVPGLETVLTGAWRALLRPVLWLPAYVLGAAAVDGAMGRLVAIWTAVPDDPATWTEVAVGWVLPVVSPLLVQGALVVYVLLHLGVLWMVTRWSGQWVGGATGVASWAGGLLAAGLVGVLHRTGLLEAWAGQVLGERATAAAEGGATGPAQRRSRRGDEMVEHRPAPWRVQGDEIGGQVGWKGSLTWSGRRPHVTWGAAAAGFRRRWHGEGGGEGRGE